MPRRSNMPDEGCSVGTLRFVGEQVELDEAIFRDLERIGKKAWTVDQDDLDRLSARTPAFAAQRIACIDGGRFDHSRRSFAEGMGVLSPQPPAK